MSTTPELDKTHEAHPKSQAIGEFLDWLQNERHLVIAEWGGKDDERLYPFHISIEALLAEYFDIDLNKVEHERRAILDELQQRAVTQVKEVVK